VEETAAQECVRQFLFVVAGDDDDRPMRGANQRLRLVDVELHAIELAQQVVRELDIGLVDLVDQQHGLPLAFECEPQHAWHDIVGNVLNTLVAELRVAKPRYRVVFVKPLLGLAGGLDVPLEQRFVERARDLLRKLRLAGARFALDQERPAERDRGIDRERQLAGCDIAFSGRSFNLPSRRRTWPRAA
jgi:hypothetical protein